jgi:adenylate kinase family enzyme
MVDVRRIYITGGSGSGKSTLAVKLSESTGFPKYELDWLLWTNSETGERVSKEERKQITGDIAEKSCWIVDGVNVGWAQKIWSEADLIIFMNIGLKLTLWRIFWRHVKAELKRNNRHPGWVKLFKFMKIVASSHRSTEAGNIDDDDDKILTRAKIIAKVEQQRHKVVFIGSSPDFDEIVTHIKRT